MPAYRLGLVVGFSAERACLLGSGECASRLRNLSYFM